MSQPSAPPLGDAALARLLRDFRRARWFAYPIVGTFALAIAIADPVPWRVGVLALALPSSIGLSFAERRLTAHGPPRRVVGNSIILVVATQLSVALATGGLVSPATLASILLGFAAAAAGAPAGARAVAMVLQVVCFFAFAALQTQGALASFIPSLFSGMASVGPGPGPWFVAVVYALVALLAHAIGARLGRTLREGYAGRLRERERTLQLMRAHAEELTLLSSEVAHELKNPLASVKGLAALVAAELEDKAAERMAVLRAEVDRMQDVMEELLTLTRPIVPLELRRVDLAALVLEVVELNQGIAVEAGVGLELSASQVPLLLCDERKIRPLLTNLIQNAIEATPRGGTVRIELSPDGDGVQVAVCDEGPGLAPEIAERAFERGVTTKATGSGIGLTTARTYAQQHGGEITLDSGERSGCAARLWLPLGDAHPHSEGLVS